MALDLNIHEKDETIRKRETAKFISSLFGESFFDEYDDYICRVAPLRVKSGVSAYAIFNRQIKRLYDLFVLKLGWTKEKFRIILWNICYRNERFPFRAQTYYDYELLYYNGELEDVRPK